MLERNYASKTLLPPLPHLADLPPSPPFPPTHLVHCWASKVPLVVEPPLPPPPPRPAPHGLILLSLPPLDWPAQPPGCTGSPGPHGETAGAGFHLEGEGGGEASVGGHFLGEGGGGGGVWVVV